MDIFWIFLQETHGKLSKKVENDEKGKRMKKNAKMNEK
jgi:hypothetical protein